MNKSEQEDYNRQLNWKVEALQECDKLKNDLAEARELLKMVFGKDCLDCKIRCGLSAYGVRHNACPHAEVLEGLLDAKA